MEQIHLSEIAEVWLHVTGAEPSFDSPFNGADYVCLVVALANCPNDFRNGVASRLVETACRHAICTGPEGSEWDDAVDWAFLETDENYEPPDERFVMTTWRELEPVEDTVFVFLKASGFDNLVFRNYLVLFVHEDESLRHRLVKQVRSELAQPERAV